MNTKPPVEIILEGIETLRKKRKDEFGNVIHYYNPIEVKQFIKSKEEKLKQIIIEVYREGFNEELPFIDMEKWYNDKFVSKFDWDKP